jgi:formylglycine-generating enzyme required for sulfatase activity
MPSSRSEPSPRSRLRGATVLVAFASLPACASLLGLDDVAIVPCFDCDAGALDGGVEAAAPVDAPSSDGDASRCPAGKGAPMVDVGGFCVDTREVSNRDYGEFLANATASGQPSPACDFNTDFKPSTAIPDRNDPDMPVRSIDWCDAWAYCHWAGKRLCGKVGGGAAGYEDYASTMDEWFVACSSNGANAYTYGPAFVASACNWGGEINGSVARVASFPSCHAPAGPLATIFDMTGNVLEWEDACDGPTSEANCRVRGGWFKSPSEESLKCSYGATRTRATVEASMGIRCCAP